MDDATTIAALLAACTVVLAYCTVALLRSSRRDALCSIACSCATAVAGLMLAGILPDALA